jgi:hypothetical protein
MIGISKHGFVRYGDYSFLVIFLFLFTAWPYIFSMQTLQYTPESNSRNVCFPWSEQKATERDVIGVVKMFRNVYFWIIMNYDLLTFLLSTYFHIPTKNIGYLKVKLKETCWKPWKDLPVINQSFAWFEPVYWWYKASKWLINVLCTIHELAQTKPATLSILSF